MATHTVEENPHKNLTVSSTKLLPYLILKVNEQGEAKLIAGAKLRETGVADLIEKGYILRNTSKNKIKRFVRRKRKTHAREPQKYVFKDKDGVDRVLNRIQRRGLERDERPLRPKLEPIEPRDFVTTIQVNDHINETVVRTGGELIFHKKGKKKGQLKTTKRKFRVYAGKNDKGERISKFQEVETPLRTKRRVIVHKR